MKSAKCKMQNGECKGDAIGLSSISDILVDSRPWRVAAGRPRRRLAANPWAASQRRGRRGANRRCMARHGAKTLWQREVGRGFAGVAVSRGTAVLFHRVGDQEVVEAWRPPPARPPGKLRFPPAMSRPFPMTMVRGSSRSSPGAGCTPTVPWDTCDASTWRPARPCGSGTRTRTSTRSSPSTASRRKDISASAALRSSRATRSSSTSAATRRKPGSSPSPRIPAGRSGKRPRERASYSSPVAVTVGGVRHVIFVTRLSVVSLDPDNGKVRFQFPFGRIGPTVNAANPVVFDGHLFVTASYGIGSVFAKIGGNGAAVLWRDPRILASQYTTCVESGGYLFGVHGRQDGPRAELRCLDPTARKVLWAEPSFGYATLIKADDKLLILKTDGTLVLAAANPNKYEELARMQVCDTSRVPCRPWPTACSSCGTPSTQMH